MRTCLQGFCDRGQRKTDFLTHLLGNKFFLKVLSIKVKEFSLTATLGLLL